jgi:hypothetical protein
MSGHSACGNDAIPASVAVITKSGRRTVTIRVMSWIQRPPGSAQGVWSVRRPTTVRWSEPVA